MAQPLAVVARTCKPVGQLQLHHLGERARFHYVRCQQDKTANHVATTDGGWTQTVRGRCYGFLVREHRKMRRMP
jgi:hypothetical protein